MKTIVQAGLANFLSNFTSIPTLDEDDDEPIVVRDCDEVENYFRLPQIALHNVSGHDHDIFNWWKQNAPDIPFLSKMARQFLAAPASSAGAERLFYGVGKMHDDLRRAPMS